MATNSPEGSTAPGSHRSSPAAMRRNAAYFLVAKVTSAGLSFAILVLVTRSLTPIEFGTYVLVSNFARLVAGLSLLGVDWAAFRYLPQYYASGSAAVLRLLLVTFVGSRSVVVLSLSVILFLAAPLVASLMGSPESVGALRLYLIIFLADGIAEFVRTSVFGALLRQGYQLISQLVRSAVNLALLGAMAASGGRIGLLLVIESEICAALLALLVAAAQLVILDRQHGRELAANNAETMPSRVALLRFGLTQYSNEVIQMLGDGSTVLVIAAHVVGLNNLALFGFARSLALQIHRFLPAENLISLVWPKVIMSFSATRSIERLARQTTLVLKLSNTVLAVVICVFVLYGREIAATISHGKYGDAYGLLLVFMIWLFVQSQRVVITVVASTVERVDMLRLPSLGTSVVTIPAVLLLAALGFGAYALAMGLVIGVSVYMSLAWGQLWRLGYRISIDIPGHLRIVGAALATLAVGSAIASILPAGLTGLIVGAVLVCLIYAVSIRLFRPFDRGERQTIERFIGRPVLLL